MASNDRFFYHLNPGDTVWWAETDTDGEFLFSFDRRKIYNFFRDYPWKLTPDEKRIFDRENPELITLKKG